MTVPLIREMSFVSRPRNDAQVAAAVPYTLEVWIGRAGDAATVIGNIAERLPTGAYGTPTTLTVTATAGKTGRYTAPVVPTQGKLYRCQINAADPGTPGDNLTVDFNFTATPG